MNYLFARKVPPRQPGDEPLDLKWAEYFDIVIVGGNKPAFLIDEGYTCSPFYEFVSVCE